MDRILSGNHRCSFWLGLGTLFRGFGETLRGSSPLMFLSLIFSKLHFSKTLMCLCVSNPDNTKVLIGSSIVGKLG